MASQSKMQSATSTSRLSADAKPFTFSSRPQYLVPSVPLVNDSLSGPEKTWYISKGIDAGGSVEDQSLVKKVGNFGRKPTDSSATQSGSTAIEQCAEPCLSPALSCSMNLDSGSLSSEFYNTGSFGDKSCDPSSCLAPAVASSYITSKFIDNERCFSKFAPYEEKCMDCPSPNNDHLQTPDFTKSDETPIIGGKEAKNAVTDGEVNPSDIMTNRLRVVCPDRSNLLNIKPKGAEGSCAVQHSPTVIDKNENDYDDSDMDSPIWPGRKNLIYPFNDSGPVDPELTACKPEAGSGLNPEAPDFFPRCIERKLSSQLGESDGYVSFSFEKRSSASPALFKNQMPQEGHPVETAGSRCSNTTQESSVSLSNPATVGQAYLVEDEACLSSDASLITETNLKDPIISTEDFTFPVTMQVASDPSLIIGTIHALSEFLGQNFSKNVSLESLDKIKSTINNLSLFTENGDAQSLSLQELTAPVVPSYLTNPPHTSKLPSTKFQVSGTKIVISPPGVSNLPKHKLQKTDPSMLMQGLRSFGDNIGDQIAKATMKTSSSAYEKERQGSPQAGIYKELWLEALKELHLMKKKHRGT